MFGKRETATSFSAGSTTLVSKNTQVVGDILFSGNLMIEGKVTGNIYAAEGSDAQARVLDNGLVEGEIRVPTIVINGTVTGDVYSNKHIELAAKAVVDGNVHYSLIEMVKGSQVNGNLVFEGKSETKAAGSVKDHQGKTVAHQGQKHTPSSIEAKVAPVSGEA
ncbi:MAG: polymer-forming cytoskeletal protein [Cellvibrionaceae bacterium]|nr:polymer-forming cytoskeletal protein [Cellvibrionaceae bacterium]